MILNFLTSSSKSRKGTIPQKLQLSGNISPVIIVLGNVVYVLIKKLEIKLYEAYMTVFSEFLFYFIFFLKTKPKKIFINPKMIK